MHTPPRMSKLRMASAEANNGVLGRLKIINARPPAGHKNVFLKTLKQGLKCGKDQFECVSSMEFDGGTFVDDAGKALMQRS